MPPFPELSAYAEYWKVPFPIFYILCVSGCDNVPGPDGTVEDKLSLIYLRSCRFTVAVHARPTFPFAPSEHKSPSSCLFALFILFLAIRLCVYLSRRSRPELARLQIWQPVGCRFPRRCGCKAEGEAAPAGDWWSRIINHSAAASGEAA